MAATPERRSIKGINEVDEYHFHTCGNENGEPLFLHHGFTGSGLVWLAMVAHLPLQQYRCIIFDTRGSGSNTATYAHYRDFTLERLADDVVGLADALGISQFSFVGHSMGGGIGMLLALLHPQRVKRLILVAPIPSDGLGFIPPKAHERDRWTRSQPDARARLAEEAKAFAARPPSDEEVERGVTVALSVTNGHFEGAWEAMLKFNVMERLHTMRVPTLMVAGAADGLLHLNLRDFEKLKLASLHVFSRVGHLIPREVPRELGECVVDFIEHGVVTSVTLAKQYMAKKRQEREAAAHKKSAL